MFQLTTKLHKFSMETPLKFVIAVYQTMNISSYDKSKLQPNEEKND